VSVVEHAPNRRSASLSGSSATFVPAESSIRCLRDQLIVEPLDVIHSRTLIVPKDKTKPLRGIVRAVGPGCYPKRYDHPDKHKRSKMWDSKQFRPTVVRVGDLVELGGAEHGGYAFQTFYWGDMLCLWCREEDVAGVCDA